MKKESNKEKKKRKKLFFKLILVYSFNDFHPLCCKQYLPKEERKKYIKKERRKVDLLLTEILEPFFSPSSPLHPIILSPFLKQNLSRR